MTLFQPISAFRLISIRHSASVLAFTVDGTGSCISAWHHLARETHQALGSGLNPATSWYTPVVPLSRHLTQTYCLECILLNEFWVTALVRWLDEQVVAEL